MQPDARLTALHHAERAAVRELRRMRPLLRKLAEKRRCLAGECSEAWCVEAGQTPHPGEGAPNNRSRAGDATQRG